MDTSATYFSDISCLGKIRLSGSGSAEFVKVMTTAQPELLASPGQASTALILNAQGDILDLVIVVRTGEYEYMIISNPQTVLELTEWLQAHAEIADSEGRAVFDEVKVENNTDLLAAIALYGQSAQKILEELIKEDLNKELGDKNLCLATIGELQVMVFRWPLLRVHSEDRAPSAKEEVFEVYLPAKASEDFKQILLGFVELDPEAFEEYRSKRQSAHTWFDAAEQASYIKPETAELQALLRPGADFVGAKALEQLGIMSH